MACEDRQPLRAARALREQLRDLGSVRAPATVLPTVLERIGQSDAYAPCDSPIGPVYVAYNGLGISAVMTAGSPVEFEQTFHTRFQRAIRRVQALPDEIVRQCQQQWSGQGRSAARIDLRGMSEFEHVVLQKVREIPRGELRPYAWVAREIGHPKAVRAVGAALRRNPVPLLIPCHRVGRSDGRVGHYVFGSAAKHTVLAAEGVDIDALASLARKSIRYHGSDTTHIYCFPTCRHARRITERHRVPFWSEAEAVDAGYRPCLVCRPA